MLEESVKLVADIPWRDIPIEESVGSSQHPMVAPGSFGLFWVEALDGGDPKTR